MTDPRDETTASYDKVAQAYATRNASTSDDFAAYRDDFVSTVGSRGLVADLGCGPGRDAAYFQSLGLTVLALDGSAGMLTLAQQAGLPVARGDLRALPIRLGALDGIWSSASLLHVPRNEVDTTLMGWRQALRTGGTLGLATSLGGDEGWEDVPYALGSQPEEESADLRRWFDARLGD